ncbi:MAG: beta-lactamase domain protein [Proteobacteria bacterium]|nr:beta-lactamase domain protein [Pseudomonadota bacterium]
MRRPTIPVLSITAALLATAFSAHAASLQEAATNLAVAKTQAIEFSGSGHWFQFGQAPNAKLPWPQFDVTKYVADLDYGKSAARVQITRLQADDPKRRRPAPSTQWLDQYVNGKLAWNLPPASQPQTASPQFAAAEERQAEIWSSPHGFIKAALANNASSKAVKNGVEVEFTVLVETEFAHYKDFNGLRFPSEIIRQQGGHPVLAIRVAEVKANPAIAITPPEEIQKAQLPAVTVKSEKLAEGVHYLTGGTHHSVAIEQKDHVVLVEAPLNEARSLALIDKVKEIIPGKPIKYLINSHLHFDHSGGLRTFVNDGATIVTHKLNEAYYKQAWAAPRSINPDRLAESKKAPRFETFTDKLVLNDGSRKIEIHNIAGSGHNDGFAIVYLPAEKILIEGDAYTPTAAGTPLPASPNPYSVNLYENIQRLKLDVDKIAALHGPRLVTLNDLRAAIGLGSSYANAK